MFLFPSCVAAALLLAGCETPLPPGVQRGPNSTISYDVLVEASAPGAKIEANGELMGEAPIHLTIFGDKDGTFHDFGSYYFVVKALPVSTNQYTQTRWFHTGRLFTPEDRIPQRIYFDMSQPTPPAGAPPPVYYEGPTVYYGPPPVYFGPSFRFYYGPRPYYHRRW